jgi:TetR/AcrR family transcriptional repressor of nem operon
MARPREFDPEEALDRAMHQFWSKGYFDTSIRDLIESTGVNYYGLYGVFENKHGLFLAALDRYRKTVTALVVEELKQPGPVRDSLRRTFERVLSLMQTPEGRVGCLMCNTAIEVAPHDRQAAAKVHEHMAHLRSSFRTMLVDAQSTGEIASDADLESLSEFLTTAVYTIGFLVRSGQDDDYVQRHILNTLAALP